MKKLTNKKGFTLMEMIIVVAIIAILAVITIPTLTGNTDKAAKAADAANLHAAKSVAMVHVMNEDLDLTKTYYFDAADGELKESAAACGECTKHDGKKIKVTFSGKEPEVVWEGAATGFEKVCE